MISIAIQTAQGFLSFTPPDDGKKANVEYRETQGGWETVNVPGLEEAITAIVEDAMGTSGGGGAPVDEGWPASIVPAPNAEYVAECKAYLAAQNPDFSGPCGAWRITHMAAYGLRYHGWGLVNSNPPHNNCNNFKVDVIMRSSDGQWVDMIQSAETDNIPSWQVGPGPMPADEWRPPPPWPWTGTMSMAAMSATLRDLIAEVRALRTELAAR